MSAVADHVKVRVRLRRDEDTWHSFETEGLWVIPQSDDLYLVDNIPFYSHGISNEDIVRAVSDAELGLEVVDGCVPSQFSTVRVWVHDAANRAKACSTFEAIGCDYEPSHDHLISLSILRARLEEVMAIVEAGEREKRWAWEEGSLRY